MFDNATARFAMSGTLITLYMASDILARRAGRSRSSVHPPRWVHPLIFVSMGAFYLLIKPMGGPVLGGWFNGIGIALCGLALALRWTTNVRYPDLGARSLFYLGLPIAIGVPWGLAVLSLPAVASSVYCCRRSERMQAAELPSGEGSLPRYRLLRGIW